MSAFLHIILPEGFIPEKTYLVRTLFEHFLGISVHIETKSSDFYTFVLPNQNKLRIRDAFFAKFEEGMEIYREENLPLPNNQTESFSQDEKGCIVLYGKPNLQRNNMGNQMEITWESDILAASFFMLTRWEEFAYTGEKDDFQRFPEDRQLSVRYGFFDRPIVNEYLETIRDLFMELGFEIPLNSREYSVFPEHDVDFFERYPDVPAWIRTISGDLLKRNNPALALESFREGFRKLFRKGPDPFDTFDFLMDESEKINSRSCFYFMPGKGIKGDEYELFSNPLRTKIMHIIERGHEIAIHPGFNTAFDSDLMDIEFSRMQRVFPEVSKSRQHFLQLSLPYTFRSLNRLGIKIETSLGFKDRNGFRNGCCYSYQYFDPIDRKELSLSVSSFTIMDSVFLRNNSNSEAALSEFKHFSNLIRRYQGDFRFIWHTSNFHLPEWKALASHYADYLSVIKL